MFAAPAARAPGFIKQPQAYSVISTLDYSNHLHRRTKKICKKNKARLAGCHNRFNPSCEYDFTTAHKTLKSAVKMAMAVAKEKDVSDVNIRINMKPLKQRPIRSRRDLAGDVLGVFFSL